MRCFFAAWPDELTRLALSAISDDVGRRVEHRRRTLREDLHLTLTFIGELSADDAVALARAAKALSFDPFEWQLDALGFFERAEVVWAGSDPGDAAAEPLSDIARNLRRLLDRLDIGHDHRPLAPHVTLLHGVKGFVGERCAPICWRVDEIGLYQSTGTSGPRYARVLG